MKKLNTPCQCEPSSYPFQCPRHGIQKTEHFHNLCMEKPDYFRAWEKGIGPGQFRNVPQTQRTHAGEVPYDKWPRYARYLCHRRQPGDIGVGDTVESYAAAIGGRKFKALAKTLGIPCGCGGRQRRLNEIYPYRKDISPDAPNCYLPTPDEETTNPTSS